MKEDGAVYGVKGNRYSEMSEPSTANRGGAVLDVRILVELMVISMILHQAYESTEDLAKLRQDISDSIT